MVIVLIKSICKDWSVIKRGDMQDGNVLNNLGLRFTFSITRWSEIDYNYSSMCFKSIVAFV